MTYLDTMTGTDVPVQTVAEAAAHAGVAVQTVYSWIRRFEIQPAGVDGAGVKTYRLADLCEAERRTRRAARRNVGLRVIATQQIRDEDAVLARLDCGHLKILSRDHAPTPGRPVACFECAALSSIHHTLVA